MVSDPPWGTAINCSYASGVGAGERRTSTASRRVEGASAAATADGSRPDLLGRAVEAVEELAELSGGGAARDGGAVAPSGLQALLGLEESTPTRSARDWDGTAGSDSADEHRQSSVGCTKNPRRAAEAGPDGLAGDGVEVHPAASEATVAGVARVSEEPCQGSDRLGFLHGTDSDLSSAVCASRAEPRPGRLGPFYFTGHPTGGRKGRPTVEACRAGGGP